MHDTSYGEAAATDPLGDMTESNLDLHRLFVTEDASTYFVALDAFAGTYGMGYGIYIDTDQVSGSGGTSDPWGRNINAVSEHLPEYALYVWHTDADAIENAQLTTWNGSGWDYPTLISLGGEQGYSGADDWLEYGIPKTALGSPAKLALEAFTIPGCCHAQDTVPSDPNVAYTAPDYSGDVTTLSAFYLFPPSAILLDLTSPADGAKFADPEIEVIGQVTPAFGVTIEIDLNGTDQFTPALDLDGNFNQLVTLASGSNILTVTATDGVDTTTVVRTVTFGAGADNDVWWDYLGHDSRDLLYRVPGGPQTTGTEVTLRFTAAKNDLTGARVRVWNDLLNQQTFYDMAIAASDSIMKMTPPATAVGGSPSTPAPTIPGSSLSPIRLSRPLTGSRTPSSTRSSPTASGTALPVTIPPPAVSSTTKPAVRSSAPTPLTGTPPSVIRAMPWTAPAPGARTFTAATWSA